MRRVDSLEKTLMLGGTGGRRRRGRRRMRWLDGVSDSMDMSLSKRVKYREGLAASPWGHRVRHDSATQQQQQKTVKNVDPNTERYHRREDRSPENRICAPRYERLEKSTNLTPACFSIYSPPGPSLPLPLRCPGTLRSWIMPAPLWPQGVCTFLSVSHRDLLRW